MALDAPGWPGIPPRWTSSDKAGVGTALSNFSSVWFTISHGILNEIYFPRLDQACTRDFGLIVTDGLPGGFFAEEKRDAVHKISALHDGVPSFLLENRCRRGRFAVEKQVIADPRHHVVLQKVRLKSIGGHLRLFALLAPRLVNGGAHNTGWLGEYKGQEMLFAGGSGTYLALASSVPWLARSVGYVGNSDGWQDLNRNGVLSWAYDRAEDGNIALSSEIAYSGDDAFLLALGFGPSWSEAALHARASLLRGFELAETEYASKWTAWQAPLDKLDPDPAHRPRGHNLYRVSTATLRTHSSHVIPGGMIASLSIPWGASKGDDDLGGYHLVWPRDLVQTANGMIAAGARDDARLVLDYLRAIQESDGRWPQNSWLDGMAYWHGIQMDECAFPILLVDQARSHGMISEEELSTFWPMVRKAAGFIVRNGPSTSQDRWEEDAGYSPFTIAVEIAALLAAAELATLEGEEGTAEFLRDTADAWNADIETWTYARDTPWAKDAGVEGYYVRITPDEGQVVTGGVHGTIAIRNRLPNESVIAADALISADALALVRFGLRAADDPRIVNTVKMIDRYLKVDLPQGCGWRRYNRDGYGEHVNGDPYDGTGEGRVWPLLIGERAHYELAAGNEAEARRLLKVMEACTSDGGMLPEQVWDADDIPERELFRGRPSGSAMPLAWAHAEYIILLHSLAKGVVFDMPPLTVQRYQREKKQPRLRDWRPTWRRTSIPAGQVLRIELTEPAMVRWTDDNWASVNSTETSVMDLGLHIVELPTQSLAAGRKIEFTWQRHRDGEWQGQNYVLIVTG